MKIKAEPKTALEELDERIQTLKANIRDTRRMYQDRETDYGVWGSRAKSLPSSAYVNIFVADLEKAAKKFAKLVKLLGRMTTETPNDTEIPSVLVMADAVEAQHGPISTWAAKIDVTDKATKAAVSSKRTKREKGAS